MHLVALTSAAILTVSGAYAQERPKIIVDNYPLVWMTEQLVGEVADVRLAAPNEVDPSFWRPSPSDIGEIQQADLIVLNGADFSKWPARSSLPRSKVVDTTAALRSDFIATEEVTHSHGADGEHSHTGTASYTWLDFEFATSQAQAISQALVRQFPDKADEILKNLNHLVQDLGTLDTLAVEGLQGASGVSIIATHPRYQYLARAYGLNITSLEWDARSMPTEAQWLELQRLAGDTSASVLLWESEPPEGAFDRAAVLGLRSVVFDPLARPPSQGEFADIMKQQIEALANVVARTE